VRFENSPWSKQFSIWVIAFVYQQYKIPYSSVSVVKCHPQILIA